MSFFVACCFTVVARLNTSSNAMRSKSIHTYCSSVLVLIISALLICDFFSTSSSSPLILAFPQQCHYQGEQYQCGTGMGCWMQGMRPVDLCSGGVMWSCCVPHSVPASPAGILHEPGKCLSSLISVYSTHWFNQLYHHFIRYERKNLIACVAENPFSRRRKIIFTNRFLYVYLTN